MSLVGPLLPQDMGAAVQLDEPLATLLQGVQPEFLWQVARMPPLCRRLLIERADLGSVAAQELLDELRLSSDFVSLNARVLKKPRVLSAESCAALRDVVDREHRSKVDTVDGAPDYQLNLSHERLAQLVGSEAVDALRRLPSELAGGGAPMDTRNAQIFVRRYTSDTRPWIPVHVDSASVTVNVALSDEAVCDGGELLALHEEGLHVVVRGEGDATAHTSTLLHAVRRLASGVRYSLIIFAGNAQRRLPPELSFDAAAREAEAAALAAAMTEAALAHATVATLGRRAAAALRANYDALRASTGPAGLGPAIERVVQTYAAPHLKPTSILARARGGEAEGACWSLQALLQYAANAMEAAADATAAGSANGGEAEAEGGGEGHEVRPRRV